MDELGVSGTIAVKQLYSDGDVNRWLEDHPDLEVLDMKFASNESRIDGLPDCYTTILIIYRKE